MVRQSIKVEYSALHGKMLDYLVKMMDMVDVDCSMDKNIVPEPIVTIDVDTDDISIENDVMDYLKIPKGVLIDTLRLENVIINKGIIIEGNINNLFIENSVVANIKGNLLVFKSWNSEFTLDACNAVLYVEVTDSLFRMNLIDVMRRVIIANSVGILDYSKRSTKKLSTKISGCLIFGFQGFATRKFCNDSDIVNSFIFTNDVLLDSKGDRVLLNSIPTMLRGIGRCPKCGCEIEIEGLCNNFRCS